MIIHTCPPGGNLSDYVYVPHDSFESIKNFQVDQYSDIIDKLGCHCLLEGGGRIPDHWIIYFEVRSTGSNPELDMDLSLGSKSYSPNNANIKQQPTDT